MFRRKADPPASPHRPACSICGAVRQVIRVMRRIGEGEQQHDDPDWAIRVCPTCDKASA